MEYEYMLEHLPVQGDRLGLDDDVYLERGSGDAIRFSYRRRIVARFYRNQIHLWNEGTHDNELVDGFNAAMRLVGCPFVTSVSPVGCLFVTDSNGNQREIDGIYLRIVKD